MQHFLPILIFILFFSFRSISQDSTNQKLQEVIIVGDKIHKFGIGNKSQSIDSTTLAQYSNQQLGDLIGQQTGAFIKNYGLSNLSSVTLRGTNASQTAILWNGLNIQSAFLGQIDFSLIPIVFFEEIKINYGGLGTISGSGAMGGAILLNNSSSELKKTISSSFGYSYGSFGNHQYQAALKLGNPKWQSVIKLWNKSGENNFPYINNLGEKKTQENAQQLQYSIMSENYFKINNKQKINLLVWHQFSDRQIPQTIQSNSTVLDSKQIDAHWRISSNWEYQSNKVKWEFKNAFFTEKLDYLSQVTSFTKAHNIISEAQNTIILKKNHLVLSGLNYTLQEVNSTNFNEKKGIHRLSWYLKYKFQNNANNLSIATGLRKEFISIAQNSPYIPFIGIDKKLSKIVVVKSNITGVYRIPTLNDLFWRDGFSIGNQSLKPESGWSSDIGTYVNIPLQKNISSSQNNTSELKFSLHFFTNQIYNSIQWQPNEEGRWSPQNILKVWSRGIESMSSLIKRYENFELTLSINTNYTVATNEKMQSSIDEAYKKQLIYVPIYNHQGNINLTWRKFNLHFNQTYTGNRFITSDNTQILPYYWLSNIGASINQRIRLVSYNIYFKINNLTNLNYQIINNYALPGINFLSGLTINFNK
ncbi:MAG: hypothetical protein EAZ07_01355 [Cytophagales bacterium]|nr:MAG: hypothetical protein EAZ07_01355 [Cytophagales bacterium]